MGIQSAEEIGDTMLLDSPLPDAEEEQKQQEDIPTGEPMCPLLLIWIFFHSLDLFIRGIFP